MRTNRRRLDAPAQQGLGLLANMVTMETFGIRGGRIHEVEVFPFVTLPFGSSDGWTPDSGRLFAKPAGNVIER